MPKLVGTSLHGLGHSMRVGGAGYFTKSLAGYICILVQVKGFGAGTRLMIHGGGHRNRMRGNQTCSISTSTHPIRKNRDGEGLTLEASNLESMNSSNQHGQPDETDTQNCFRPNKICSIISFSFDNWSTGTDH